MRSVVAPVGSSARAATLRGDEVASLRPRECLGQRRAQLDQRVPGECTRRSPSATLAWSRLLVGGDGAAGEGCFHVVDLERLELDTTEFVREYPDGPVVAGEAGGGEVPVGQRFGPPELEEFGNGAVPGDDRQSVIGGAAQLVEFVARFGLGARRDGAGFTVDTDSSHPPVAVGAVEQGSVAATSSTLLGGHQLPPGSGDTLADTLQPKVSANQSEHRRTESPYSTWCLVNVGERQRTSHRYMAWKRSGVRFSLAPRKTPGHRPGLLSFPGCCGAR